MNKKKKRTTAQSLWRHSPCDSTGRLPPAMMMLPIALQPPHGPWTAVRAMITILGPYLKRMRGEDRDTKTNEAMNAQLGQRSAGLGVVHSRIQFPSAAVVPSSASPPPSHDASNGRGRSGSREDVVHRQKASLPALACSLGTIWVRHIHHIADPRRQPYRYRLLPVRNTNELVDLSTFVTLGAPSPRNKPSASPVAEPWQ